MTTSLVRPCELGLIFRNNLLGLVSRLQGARKEDIRDNGDIQWDKFALIYDILSIVSECQGKDTMVSGASSEVFKRLIEDTPIISDEDVSTLHLSIPSRFAEEGRERGSS